MKYTEEELDDYLDVWITDTKNTVCEELADIELVLLQELRDFRSAGRDKNE